MPRRLANYRRLAPFRQPGTDLTLQVDDAQDFSLLQYYISRERQRRDLAEAGFTLIECLDEAGEQVPEGASGDHSVSLMYVARRAV
jgi:hypothetical protein